jgi:pimeloyl-ACP methyl ester carboxylesterase
MPRIAANDIELHYEIAGSGPPLVMVHGSWTDGNSWAAVVPRVADRFRVITYDRRGHSRSASLPLARSRIEHEDDLARLIEGAAAGPAYVAANSFGGVIALGLAARRPELFRRLAIHEPPAVALSSDAETARAVATMHEARARIDAGEHELAARHFVEEVALGPGSWQLLPEEIRATFVANAATFAAEVRDPGVGDVDPVGGDSAGLPLLITKGTESPRWFRGIADRLGGLHPTAATATIAGAGHAPHLTHPRDYAELLTAFFLEERAVAA